jgi:hypothetical protein
LRKLLSLLNFHTVSLSLSVGYDATCNPTIFTEFSSAAFRFGHSLLKEQFRRMGANFVDRKLNVKLRDVFMNPGNWLFFVSF